MPGDPFRLDDLPFTPLSRAALIAARPLLERFLRIDQLRRSYFRAQHLAGSFPARVLSALNISIAATGQLSALPTSGPLIIVANHPLGALDGLVVASMFEAVRPDARLLANRLLHRLPEMRELCFFVNPFRGAAAVAESRGGLRAAHLWLRQGHALVMFPAGEVAHGKPVHATRSDSPWADTVGRLALATGATVAPIGIHGVNSALFYALGRIHPMLRTALLPRELIGREGSTVPVSVGEPIVRSTLASAGCPSAATALMRSSVEALLSRDTRDTPPTPETLLSAEVDRIPAANRLASSGTLEVFAVSAAAIPLALREIGRLRELTYRAVGEGTGRNLDVDEFDAYYTHLFLWDRQAKCVVGAYRIGDVESIVRERGVDGLYTRRLFSFDRRFVQKLGPALELGRSWIREEYQKNYNALLTLWRGIGRFVVERSNARVLFGPVSISACYSDSSHALLMAFLEQNHRDESLAALVGARHPKRVAPEPAAAVMPRTIDDIHRLVSQLERDGKGLPVLLRQYLKLNARLIGFNVDPEFGDALDALMMVDLTTVDRAILKRYLGSEGARTFLARQTESAQHSHAA